jgi:hypothetical protein
MVEVEVEAEDELVDPEVPLVFAVAAALGRASDCATLLAELANCGELVTIC